MFVFFRVSSPVKMQSVISVNIVKYFLHLYNKLYKSWFRKYLFLPKEIFTRPWLFKGPVYLLSLVHWCKLNFFLCKWMVVSFLTEEFVEKIFLFRFTMLGSILKIMIVLNALWCKESHWFYITVLCGLNQQINVMNGK